MFVRLYQVAWAPGRGCKGSNFKACWVLKQGVTVVPWSLVKEQEELNNLGDGGEVELETLPPGLRLPPPQDRGDGEAMLESYEAPYGGLPCTHTGARTLGGIALFNSATHVDSTPARLDGYKQLVHSSHLMPEL